MYIHRESHELLANVSFPVCPVAHAIGLGSTAAGAAKEADRYVKQVCHAHAGRGLWRLNVFSWRKVKPAHTKRERV